MGTTTRTPALAKAKASDKTNRRLPGFTREAALERNLPGVALLLEDAGVVLNAFASALVVYKEYGDGKLVRVRRFEDKELLTAMGWDS